MIWLALLAQAVGSGATLSDDIATATKSLPPFTFKNLTADQDIPDQELRGCSKQKDGTLMCSGAMKIAGHISFFAASVYNRRLADLFVSSNKSNWPDIMRAFEAKYGKPSESHSEPWRSKGGLTIENVVSTWNFSTGVLTLAETGNTLDDLSIRYRDSNRPPAPAPKVDF